LKKLLAALLLSAVAVSAPAALARKEKKDKDAWDITAAHGPTTEWRATLTSGTWISVDVHPDGDRLVFDLLGDLYLLPLEGGAAQPLTSGAAWDQDARWSPDGRRLLYVSDQGGNQELWIRDMETGEAAALTSGDPERFVEGTWSPDGRFVVGRKRLTDTRSIGVCELWLFDTAGGDGVKLTETGEHPFPNEPTFSADGRFLYFSSTPWRIDYNRNPHAGGIFNLHRLELETGEVLKLTGEAGGAFRPAINPATGEIAVLRREGEETVLDLFDPETGARRPLARGFSRDQQEGFNINGVYPHISWTPDGAALLAWAKGGLVRVDGETGATEAVPFSAQARHRLHRPVQHKVAVADGEAVTSRHVRWPRVSPDGQRVVFEAFGRLWLQGVDEAAATPLTDGSRRALSPSWSPDGRRLAYATWHDEEQGEVRVRDMASGEETVVSALPAQHLSPAWSPDGRKLAWFRGSGAPLRGHDTGGELWYRLEVADLETGEVSDLGTWDTGGGRATDIGWTPDGERLLVFDTEAGDKPHSADTLVLKSVNLDGRDPLVVARWAGARSAAISPDGRRIAWQEGWKVYATELPPVGGEPLALSAGGGPFPVEELSTGAGDWLAWSGDEVSWTLGPALTVGDRQVALSASLPRAHGEARFAYAHGRILTMGPQGVIEDGYVLVDGERIEAVGAGAPPAGVAVVDLGGRAVMPGLIDVHAHMHYGFSDAHPQSSWRHEINLAYGATTVHDPSANNDIVFPIAERIAAGVQVGPRVYSTGGVIYGAKGRDATPLADLEEARMNLERLAASGAHSVKSYQQPARRQRQWLLQAAREVGLNVYPEGGGDLMNNLTMLLDGHTGIEHALPVAPLYADVRGLYAASGVGYTPTLLVGYGGLFGENWFYQYEDLLGDEKWTHFTPADEVAAIARRRGILVKDGDWWHLTLSQEAAALQDAGVLVQLGAHGQLQGLGVHWELWALGEGMGPEGALRAATIDGARYLGMADDLGSLEAGKLADLLVIDGDPMTNLRDSTKIDEVVQGGVRYDADTLEVIAR
jgi:Tol biopolymer transport system component/imidazolonepropionase-like amidohydrolase